MKKDANYAFEFKVDMESEFVEQLQDAIGVHFHYGCTVLGDDRKIRKAIKKQTPQKVGYEDVGYNHFRDVNVYGCICPSCGLTIIEFDDDDVFKPDAYVDSNEGDVEKMFKSKFVHHGYIGRNSYCDRCGQKLDWGKYGR